MKNTIKSSSMTVARILAAGLIFTYCHPPAVECVEGRLFFLAYMNLSTTSSSPANGIQEIFISTIGRTGKVRLQYQPLNYTELISLNSTNNYQYTKTLSQDLAGPLGTMLPASIIISSEVDISVQTNKAEDKTGGGYLALPITASSTQFYMASYTPRGGQSMLSIAAPYDTCVDIRFVNNTSGYRMMYLSLPPGTVYHASSQMQDYTGVFIKSSKPIAVYGGVDCALVPYDEPITSCDHIIEQIPYIDKSGVQNFILSSVGVRSFSAGFQYRIVAAGNTTCSINTMSLNPISKTLSAPALTTTGLLFAGNFFEGNAGRNSNNPTVVLLSCSAPCLVMQYSPAYDAVTLAGNAETNKPDDFMMTVPALNHYTSDITFSTSKYYVNSGNTTSDFVNGITIIANKSSAANIKIDGTTVLTSFGYSFDITTPSPFAGYTVFYGSVTPGYHTVVSSVPSDNFTVFVYGSAPVSSPGNTGYGYLAGYRYDMSMDSPITTGPWFDFTTPSTPVSNPAVDNTSMPASVPLQPGDSPNYTVIWEANFYTIEPDVTDLKTRNCSEAYYRYYLAQRFLPMIDKLNLLVKSQCSPGMNATMTNLLYYSEYTHGLIRILVTINGTGSARIQDIFDCASLVSGYISEFSNWAPGYKTVLDFLKNDIDPTIGCAALHMDPPEFTSTAKGWICPQTPTPSASFSSDGNNLCTNTFMLTALVALSLFVKYLQ